MQKAAKMDPICFPASLRRRAVPIPSLLSILLQILLPTTEVYTF